MTKTTCALFVEKKKVTNIGGSSEKEVGSAGWRDRTTMGQSKHVTY